MTRERGSRAESKNCEILLLPTADRRFDTKVKCSTGRASFWVKFPTVRILTRVKCPGIARGGMGGFGIDWYITRQLKGALAFCDLDCSSYKSLSVRIGAPSLAAKNGMSDAQIRGLGRWKSDAFKLYIRSPTA